MAGAEDIEEMKELLSRAKRPYVKSFISSHILALEKAQVATLEQEARAKPLQTTVVQPGICYITLSSFSWDQDDEKVKIYVSVEGVSEDKIVSEFHPSSFEVKLHDISGKNYRFGIQRLHKAIMPEKCLVIVKPKRITITLKKKEKLIWKDLHYKEDKTSKIDSEQDPVAGVMDLMKNMYAEGDSDMKKTIEKAWSDSKFAKKSW